MSEIAATNVHEAYAFACMRCGYGWEQAYEIEHHVDGSGNDFVVYKADGKRVPSPLSTLTCTNCGAHVIRIMQAGRVSSVQQLLEQLQKDARASRSVEDASEPAAVLASGAPEHEHRWHLSGLLRPFRRG